MIETSPPEGTAVQPFAAKAAWTSLLIRSTNSGSFVLTCSHEYVLYCAKFTLRSYSVFTCCADNLPANTNIIPVKIRTILCSFIILLFVNLRVKSPCTLERPMRRPPVTVLTSRYFLVVPGDATARALGFRRPLD